MDRRADLKVKLIELRTTEEERKSISTSFNARDMAAVVDALGEADFLLNYYGVSYGTVLGATFAAVFPEKIGRVVLDSVVGE
jgi:pimeloyl-ACP methyl ester carboxylesterase